MSNLPQQPFISKDVDDVLGELLEQVVIGIVPVEHEEYTFTSGTSTYTLTCGSPDISEGKLIEVNRIWSIVEGSFYEFIENTDFTVNLTNNQITFITEPDDDVLFYVSYKYDQQIVSGLTDTSQGSVVRVLLQSVSHQIASCWRSLELLRAAAYIDTAQGEDLDELLKLVGVTRNIATEASGYVTFYRDTTSGYSPIPQGTQVAAQRTDRAVVYETVEVSAFYDGFSSARAPIEAIPAYAGKIGNMAPNRITKLMGSAGGASRCNNPAYYTDYEFYQLLEGKFTYVLAEQPKRVINTEGFLGNTSPPWAESDNGVIAIWNFRDTSMETANWTTNNVELVQDEPETGQLQCSPTTTASAYISRTFSVNFHTYPHVFVMVRGTEDDEFNVEINNYTVSMYEFASTSSTTQGLANLNWTLYAGALYRPIVNCINLQNDPPGSPETGDRYVIGDAPTGVWAGHADEIAQYNGSWSYASPADRNIVRLTASTSTYNHYIYASAGTAWSGYSESTSTFEIIFKSTNIFWVDFVGMGHELDEIQGAALSGEDEVKVNYTAKTLGLWYVDENNQFYQKYDGDDSDGSIDYLFAYYKWNNHISGGGDEETDDALRVRGKGALHVAAKGTKDALKNAILEIDGISQCQVSDYNDDSTIPPGVCHIHILARGFVVSPSLSQEVVDAVDEVRAAGIQANIYTPQVRYVNFTLNVVYNDALPDYVGETGQATLRAVISSAIDDFFAEASINEALYFSDLLGYIIREVKGVVAAHIDWDESTTPAVSDDNYDEGYAYDSGVVLDDPQRISGIKTDATIVVQRGKGVTSSSFVLYRRSEKR